jgi:hypothetical protein
MKKRISAIILTLALVLSMFSGQALAATTRTNEKANYTTAVTSQSELEARLNKLMSKYVGTYWTTDGKAANSSGSTSKYYYGIQCKGFASYIWNDLFATGFIGSTSSAKYYLSSPSKATLIGKNYGYYGNSAGANTVKSVLSKAQPGDLIQVKRRSTGNPHTMIVVSVSSSGITVFDCNSDGKCGVRKYALTWTAFAQANIGFSLYHSTNYPKASSTSSSSSTPSTTTNSTSTGYFKKYTGSSSSFVDALKAIGENSSYSYRKTIASKNGISNYSGTAAQNSSLLRLLKSGKLQKP